MFSTPMFLQGDCGMWKIYIYKKRRLLDVLFLTHQNLASFELKSKTKQQ